MALPRILPILREVERRKIAAEKAAESLSKKRGEAMAFGAAAMASKAENERARLDRMSREKIANERAAADELIERKKQAAQLSKEAKEEELRDEVRLNKAIAEEKSWKEDRSKFVDDYYNSRVIAIQTGKLDEGFVLAEAEAAANERYGSSPMTAYSKKVVEEVAKKTEVAEVKTPEKMKALARAKVARGNWSYSYTVFEGDEDSDSWLSDRQYTKNGGYGYYMYRNEKNGKQNWLDSITVHIADSESASKAKANFMKDAGKNGSLAGRMYREIRRNASNSGLSEATINSALSTLRDKFGIDDDGYAPTKEEQEQKELVSALPEGEDIRTRQLEEADGKRKRTLTDAQVDIITNRRELDEKKKIDKRNAMFQHITEERKQFRSVMVASGASEGEASSLANEYEGLLQEQLKIFDMPDDEKRTAAEAAWSKRNDEFEKKHGEALSFMKLRQSEMLRPEKNLEDYCSLNGITKEKARSIIEAKWNEKVRFQSLIGDRKVIEGTYKDLIRDFAIASGVTEDMANDDEVLFGKSIRFELDKDAKNFQLKTGSSAKNSDGTPKDDAKSFLSFEKMRESLLKIVDECYGKVPGDIEGKERDRNRYEKSVEAYSKSRVAIAGMFKDKIRRNEAEIQSVLYILQAALSEIVSGNVGGDIDAKLLASGANGLQLIWQDILSSTKIDDGTLKAASAAFSESVRLASEGNAAGALSNLYSINKKIRDNEDVSIPEAPIAKRKQSEGSVSDKYRSMYDDTKTLYGGSMFGGMDYDTVMRMAKASKREGESEDQAISRYFNYWTSVGEESIKKPAALNGASTAASKKEKVENVNTDNPKKLESDIKIVVNENVETTKNIIAKAKKGSLLNDYVKTIDKKDVNYFWKGLRSFQDGTAMFTGNGCDGSENIRRSDLNDKKRLEGYIQEGKRRFNVERSYAENKYRNEIARINITMLKWEEKLRDGEVSSYEYGRAMSANKKTLATVRENLTNLIKNAPSDYKNVTIKEKETPSASAKNKAVEARDRYNAKNNTEDIKNRKMEKSTSREAQEWRSKEVALLTKKLVDNQVRYTVGEIGLKEFSKKKVEIENAIARLGGKYVTYK